VKQERMYPGLYPPGSDPHNKKYETWLEEYTTKLLETHVSKNPNFDQIGTLSSKLKIGKVIMLAGAYGDNWSREISIPAGHDILVCAGFKNDTFAEDTDIRSGDEKALVNRVQQGTSYVTRKYISIDGKNVRNLDDFLVQTRIFDITFPKVGAVYYSVRAGPTKCVARGWPVIVKPFPKHSQHIIKFGIRAEIPSHSPIYNQLGNRALFEMNIKYTVNVE